MNAALQSSVPISVVMTGTTAATARTVASKQLALLQVLKLYTCQAATRLPVASVNRCPSQPPSALLYCTPPAAMTFVAPVWRIADTSSCIPAAANGAPDSLTPHAPPSCQHVHAFAVSLLPSGNGSLNSSRITVPFPRNAVATELQNASEGSRSGMLLW